MGFLSGIFGGSGGSSSSTNSNSNTSVNYPPYLENLAAQIAGNTSSLLNTPFPTYDSSKVFAPFQPTQTQAFNQVGNNQTSWQPFFSAATGALNTGSGAANGYFGQAGAQPSPLTQAQPYFNAAATTWNTPGVAQSYMNPFISGSVNYGNQLASQNFLQNVLPGLTQQFVAGSGGGDGSRGALGSPQYQKATDWALTNFNNSVLGNTQNALANGYFNSANQFQTDQSRLAGLGSASGSLGATGTGLLTNLGSAQNNANAADAGIFGQLGNYFSNNNLTNTNALLQVGNQQQQQAQNPLSFNYQQFLNQQNWPFQLQSWATGIESGLKTPMTTSTTSNSTTNQSANSSPSLFGSVLGGLSALQGLGGFTGISNLFSGLGGSAPYGGTAPKTGGFILPNGYFSETASSRPKKLGFAGGGYLDLDVASIPDYYERPDPPRGGYFSDLQPRRLATGGLAVTVNAGRKQTGAYLKSEQRRQAALQRAEMAASKPLATKGGGFFGGRFAALPMTRSSGYFAHV